MVPQRILVPVDFSEQSMNSLQVASEFAKAFDAKLTLLHVHSIIGVAVLDFTYVERPQDLARITEAAEKQLDQAAAKLNIPDDKLKVEVVTGDPVTEIVRHTSQHDLVIMSTHGHSGLTRFLMGSVSERVVRGAHCSVLVVRSQAN